MRVFDVLNIFRYGSQNNLTFQLLGKLIEKPTKTTFLFIVKILTLDFHGAQNQSAL